MDQSVRSTKGVQRMMIGAQNIAQPSDLRKDIAQAKHHAHRLSGYRMFESNHTSHLTIRRRASVDRTDWSIITLWRNGCAGIFSSACRALI